MNTRLQVEHPVTEMTTGIDLVHAQIRIAQGATLKELGLEQHSIPVKGHAIECRLYAEDPNNNFFPCTGRILTWSPAKVAGVRYDGGIRSGMFLSFHNCSSVLINLLAGSEITVFYDPLICKIIAYAPSRNEVRYYHLTPILK